MWKEFRDFLLRGNVIELGVAIVIGAAFTAVVTAFVTDILTPLLGLVGVPDFSTAQLVIGGATIKWGLFLNALISFILVGAAVFFFVVRPLQRIAARNKSKEPATPLPPTELTVLQEIRDELKAQRGARGPASSANAGSVELRSDAGNPPAG
jgi:large conductance mechanosensitive channel